MTEHVEVVIHAAIDGPPPVLHVQDLQDPRVKGRPPRGSQLVTLIWLRRRFQCQGCSERHTESHPASQTR